jgi:hypothetical protein
VPAEKDRTRNEAPEREGRAAQPRTIRRGGSGRGWSRGAALAKGQVAAQDGKSGRTEMARNGEKQGRVAIAAGAMRQNETLRALLRRPMQKAADFGLLERDDVFTRGHDANLTVRRCNAYGGAALLAFALGCVLPSWNPEGGQVVTDKDVWRVAKHVIEEHGEAAPIVATLCADDFLASGKLAAHRVWKSVVKAVGELQRAIPHDGERVN